MFKYIYRYIRTYILFSKHYAEFILYASRQYASQCVGLLALRTIKKKDAADLLIPAAETEQQKQQI